MDKKRFMRTASSIFFLQETIIEIESLFVGAFHLLNKLIDEREIFGAVALR